MTRENVWGAAPKRGGASDITMLVWKVVEARPGITREEIWARVEQDIPFGYALRVYHRSGNYRRDHSSNRRSYNHPQPDDELRRARQYVLTMTLANMRSLGIVKWEGSARTGVADGAGDNRRYTAGRQPRYYGNPDFIDATGTKAAEHLALADALRKVDKALAAARKSTARYPGLHARTDAALFRAIETLADHARAKPPGS